MSNKKMSSYWAQGESTKNTTNAKGEDVWQLVIDKRVIFLPQPTFGFDVQGISPRAAKRSAEKRLKGSEYENLELTGQMQ